MIPTAPLIRSVAQMDLRENVPAGRPFGFHLKMKRPIPVLLTRGLNPNFGITFSVFAVA